MELKMSGFEWTKNYRTLKSGHAEVSCTAQCAVVLNGMLWFKKIDGVPV